MLSRKAYCKECYRVFNRQLYKTKGGKTVYLKCKGRRIKKEECINDRSIRGDILEQIILDEFNSTKAKFGKVQEQINKINKEIGQISQQQEISQATANLEMGM